MCTIKFSDSVSCIIPQATEFYLREYPKLLGYPRWLEIQIKSIRAQLKNFSLPSIRQWFSDLKIFVMIVITGLAPHSISTKMLTTSSSAYPLNQGKITVL